MPSAFFALSLGCHIFFTTFLIKKKIYFAMSKKIINFASRFYPILIAGFVRGA